MLKGGISQHRNKGLFKMFNLIGLGEHAGFCVPVYSTHGKKWGWKSQLSRKGLVILIGQH